MKKLLLLIFCIYCISFRVNAQCNETIKTRVLLVGDSWANFMGLDSSISNSLKKWGHSNYTFYTNSNIAVSGTTTDYFMDPAKLAEIQNQLNAHPDIDFVHLSIGGNDVLNSWNVNFTQAQTDSLLDSVYTHISYIIDNIKTMKPGIRIVWSGYTYPNFAEIIDGLAPFQSTHPYYAIWQSMGFPSIIQINTILNSASATLDSIAANDPQVDFVKAPGLMQYTFGQSTALGVPPGGSYAPYAAPLPLGYTDYPSPKNSMRTYVIFRDCFHLSPQGYSDFMDYQTQKLYQKALMDDQYILSEGGTHDGAVSSIGTVVPDVQMGNSGSEDFAAVLSFNTTAMPDTGVSKASIFLRRESLTGANPAGNTIQIKIKSGNFSASADVEASDYSAPGDANGSPCQFGSTAGNGSWIRLEVPASLLPFITHNNLTQFIISAPGATGLVTYTGATDPDFAPVLNITYGPATVSLAEPTSETNEFIIYPNPTSGVFYIENKNVNPVKVEIYDLPGKLVMQTVMNTSRLDLSEMPSGMYVVKIYTKSGIVSKRMNKR